MSITPKNLVNIMQCSFERANTFCDYLNEAMEQWEINTPERQAIFLAQIAQESGALRYVKELASGAAYDTGRKAANLGNTPEADGDGQFFKGHGLIQITGRDNHIACGEALGLDLLTEPELLCEPEWAAKSAAWFFSTNGCNELSDNGSFIAVTKRINGGTTHLNERLEFWAAAKIELNASYGG